MLKKVKKLVSLVLVLAMSFIVCVPAFAADKGIISVPHIQFLVEN